MNPSEDITAHIIWRSLRENQIVRLEFIPAPYNEFAWIFHHNLIGDILIDSNYQGTRDFILGTIYKYIQQGGESPRDYLVWIANEYAYLKE